MVIMPSVTATRSRERSPMSNTARDLTFSRAQLEERACRSLLAQDFRSGLAPLCRLLLTLPPHDSERAVVLACLAVVYARMGRREDAECALRSAERASSSTRAFGAIRLARTELGGR